MPTIRKEINLLTYTLTTSSKMSGSILMNSSSFYGSSSYFFEIVGSVSSGTATASLFGIDLVNNQTIESNITFSSTTASLFRTSFIPSSSLYGVSVQGGSTTRLKSAKIVIYQDYLSNKLFTTESSVDLTEGPVYSLINTSAAPYVSEKYWYYNSSNWSGISYVAAWISHRLTNTGTFTYVFQSSSDLNTWTNEISSSLTAFSTGDSSFEFSIGSLSPNKYYRLISYAASNMTSYNLYLVKLIIRQTALSKLADPITGSTDIGKKCSAGVSASYVAIIQDSSPYLYIYKRTNDSLTRLANPSTIPPYSCYDCCFSKDNDQTYLTVGYSTNSNFSIYKRNGDTFTKLADPSTVPLGTVWACDFSYSNEYLAIGHTLSPYVSIYKRNGDTFTKLDNPATLPTRIPYSVSFSSEDDYLALGHQASPYLSIYKRNGDTFTKLADPSTVPEVFSSIVKFVPNSNLLAYLNINNDIVFYKRTGDEFTYLAEPKLDYSNIFSSATGFSFDMRGNYCLVAHTRAPHIDLYSIYGHKFTKLNSPSTFGNITLFDQPNKCDLSLNGEYAAIPYGASPYIHLYKNPETTRLSNYTESEYQLIDRIESGSGNQRYLTAFNNDDFSNAYVEYKTEIIGKNFLKTANPTTLPTGIGNFSDFSSDGTYLSVAHTTSPYVSIYKFTGSSFVKLANPSTLPTGTGNSCAFSSGSNYLAIAHTTSPYVTIYSRSGDTFTKLTNPSTLPTGNALDIDFSSDNNYLAIAHTTSPYVTIYSRSGVTFTKLTNPSTLPTGTGNGCSFSSDVNYLAVGHTTSPYVTIYSRSGDTFTKLTNPSTLPTGTGNGVDFSSTDSYFTVSHATSPFITIYSKSGSVFTKLTNPSTLPTGTGNHTHFTPNDRYLVCAHATTPFVTIYRNFSGSFTKLTNPSTLPPSTGNGVAIDNKTEYIAVAHTNSPYVTIYEYPYFKIQYLSGSSFVDLNENSEISGIYNDLNSNLIPNKLILPTTGSNNLSIIDSNVVGGVIISSKIICAIKSKTRRINIR